MNKTENTAPGITPLTLASLQQDKPDVLNTLLSSYVLGNREAYESSKSMSTGLFAASTPKVGAKPKRNQVIFAVDDYAETNKKYTATAKIPATMDFSVIIPRSSKAKEIQKRRVKEKAEVFTPTWVCNVQNNLVDDHSVRPGAFNTYSAKPDDTEDQRHWIPSESPVFESTIEAVEYIHLRRLEITSGEAPYLSSGYDTVTGQNIPVRDAQGRFQRIGLLDRKMRVVTETSGSNRDLWLSLAYGALCSTFGYEWQGDNLLLARLNLLNAYRDYFVDAWYEEPSDAELHQIAVVISMNLWQMDGLSNTTPLDADTLPLIAFDHGGYPFEVAFSGRKDGVFTKITTPPTWTVFNDLVGETKKKGKAKK